MRLAVGQPPARRTAGQSCTLSSLFADLGFDLRLRIFSFAQRSGVIDVSVNDYDDGERTDYREILKPSRVPRVLRGVLSGLRFYCVSELPLYLRRAPMPVRQPSGQKLFSDR